MPKKIKISCQTADYFERKTFSIKQYNVFKIDLDMPKKKTVKKLIKDFEETTFSIKQNKQHFRSSKILIHIETSLPSSIRKLMSTKP